MSSTVESILNTSATGTTVNANDVSSLDRDDFLELLVTKLQNQDPLNPMDDEDFIAQLAQFSSLEQMQNIADAIDESNSLDYVMLQSLNNNMSASFVGKDVRASYSGIYLEEGSSAQVSFTLDEYASKVTLTIKNEDGDTVATVSEDNLGSGVHTVTWDGCSTFGNQMPEGYYTITATAVAPSGDSFTPALELTGRVEAVLFEDGVAYLKVGDTEIPLGDVTAIGEHGAFDDEEE